MMMMMMMMSTFQSKQNCLFTAHNKELFLKFVHQENGQLDGQAHPHISPRCVSRKKHTILRQNRGKMALIFMFMLKAKSARH